jgi:copper transport protein
MVMKDVHYMIKIRKRRAKTSLKLIVLIFVSLSILVAVPNIPKSYAHAFVIYSDPAPSTSLNKPPSQIEIDFVDPIDIRYSMIKVLDSNGKSVQNNDWHFISPDHQKTLVTLPPIPNGIYTVYTKVLDAADGHTTTNAFVFAVGVPVPANLLNSKTNVSFTDIVSIQDTLSRYPSLVGQIIVVGAAFSSLWLWRPISRISGLKTALESTRIKMDKSMTKIVLVGSIVILGGDFAMITAAAYSINAGLLEAINTSFGNTWLIRMALSSALFGIALILYFKQKKSNTILAKNQVATLFGIGIAVLTTTSLISHGAASGKILPPIFDFVHNLVASLWIGSVIYLAFVLVPRLKEMQDDLAGMSVVSLIIPRFSTVVVALLGIVVITGPSLLYSLENNLSITLASIYGEILIIKLSLACAMISLGAFNQRIIQKRAINAIPLSSSNDKSETPSSGYDSYGNKGKSILAQFEKSIKVEVVIGFVLIASIAFLVDSGTPGIQFQNELVQQQQQIPHVFAFTAPLNSLQNKFTETGITDEGNKIVLSVEPFYAGTNKVTISFLDQNNKPININSTKITLNQVDKGIGPLAVNEAQQISPGVFSVNTAAFAIPGHWQAQVEGITTQAGALNVVTTFDDLYVKPNLSQLQANITEYKMPDSSAQPWYPIYDNIRNVVWFGDYAINTGRIWEFDLVSKQYTEHKINGTYDITFTALDFNNNIWYLDPHSKILGYYEPDSKKEQKYSIPINGTAAGIAMDGSDNPWLIDASNGKVLKFDVSTKTFHTVNLASNSSPLGISVDQSSGQIWIAESGIGKIANIDPAQNYKITEYSPFNATLTDPQAILFDSVSGKVFISEHEGKAISVFDPLIKTFQKYETDPNGLPFGMAFDANHDLWLAQHTLNKIAVIDPRTGKTNEFDIPTQSSFTQWITTDSQGDIILAEQRANALGILTSSLRPGFVENTEQESITLGIPLGFSYADLAGPSIAVGLIAVAFIYSKSAIDFGNSIRKVKKSYIQPQ